MMNLVDTGKINLDQPLEALLQRPVSEYKKRITPRLLLTHCAGFVDWMPFYLELESVAPKDRKTLQRERLLNLPLVYPPGAQVLYSDLGFMLLEWVIEKTTGLALPRFVEQEIYAPMSLK